MSNFSPQLSISEFSRLSGVSRKTLIYYDRIGLFQPEAVRENGYRCYSSRQLETYGVIYALKEIGMSLSEIKSYLDQRTPQSLTTLLENQKKRMEEEIEKLIKIQKMMENRIQVTRLGQTAKDGEIFLREQEKPCQLLLSAEMEDRSETAQQNAFLDFYDACEQNAVCYGYPVGMLVPKDNLLANSGETGGKNETKQTIPSYSHYFINLGDAGWELYGDEGLRIKSAFAKLSQMPKGLYATGWLKGDYYEDGLIGAFYKKILAFIRQQGLTVTGDAYEETLYDEITVSDPSDYLLQISILVSQHD